MLHRRILAAAALVAISAGAAAADTARDALHRTALALAKLRYAHLVLTTAQQTIQADYAAPDRFRINLGIARSIVIGPATYVNAGAGWMTFQTPETQQIVSDLKLGALAPAALTAATITDLGEQRLDGVAVHEYRIRTTVQGMPTDTSVWIGSDDLPRKSETLTAQGDVTVTYSQFNVPVTIMAPRN
jgi:hypothetical protein